jgi:class 3 adenylate cyclase
VDQQGASRKKPEHQRGGGDALQSIRSASLAELMSIWRSRLPEEGSGSPALFRSVGERILAHGEPLLAYDVVTAGLAVWPKDTRLRQLQGLALARSGASDRASAILEQLRDETRPEEETLGMLGRTYKDLAETAATEERRREFLKNAARTYQEAYRTSGGYWSGINAATMTLLIGEKDRACEIARQVHEQCLKEIRGERGDSYWLLAALGEAALICQDRTQAGEWYARAAGKGSTRYGDINSSRRNARLILKHWNEDPSWIDNYLRIPSVIVFAGHMIDRADRSEPRFPPESESAVAAEIRKELDRLQPGFAFSSAACGSDILFLEAMLDRGAEVSVILPYSEEEFIRDSVAIVQGGEWRTRFDRVLARAARVMTASSQRLEVGGVSYEFCNDLTLGLATIRARQLDTQLITLAVWNGMPGDGPGGAACAVQNWQRRGYEPEIIDLSEILAGSSERPGRGGNSVPAPSVRPSTGDNQVSSLHAFASRIVAILFADAVGFSKLREPEVPRFVQYFLGPIAELSDKFADSILTKNTWGDGLYFVLSDMGRAGEFALELAAQTAETNWTEKGLPADISLRIALHAGPAYEFDDPITGSRNYSGTHVSRAARIEPITPRGQVYASEAFAALAAAQQVTSFACDYVGQTPMAKSYGTLPTYHVRRKFQGR